MSKNTNNVKKIRVMSGLSIRQLSGELGKTPQTIWNWEHLGIPKQFEPILKLIKMGEEHNLKITKEDLAK